MATWHQLRGQRRARKAGRPINFQHETGWTVVIDPPHEMRSAITFNTKPEADRYAAKFKHTYVIPPANHLTANPRRTRIASRAVTVSKLRKRSANRPTRAAKKIRRIRSATFRKHATRRIEKLMRNPARPLPVKHLWTIEASFPRKSRLWWHFTNDCTFADTGGNRMLFHSPAEAARRMNLIKKAHGATLIKEGCERMRVSRFQ